MPTSSGDPEFNGGMSSPSPPTSNLVMFHRGVEAQEHSRQVNSLATRINSQNARYVDQSVLDHRLDPRRDELLRPRAAARSAARSFARSARRRPRDCSPESSKRSRDRKSTRLNSSHLVISYAVFCLKKKKEK